MPEISRATRIQLKAKERIVANLARAKNSYANIPLGEKRYDPRTEKKRAEAAKMEPGMDTTLHRLLYEMRNGQNG
jgi:hypothetical protein